MSVRPDSITSFFYLFFSTIVFPGFATQAQTDLYADLGKSTLVAVGPDFSLRLRDIDKQVDPELGELLQQLHRERLRVLRTTVTEHVLEKEAQALKISKAELQRRWEDNMEAVSEADVEAFLSRNNTSSLSPGPVDRQRIKLFLQNQRRKQVQGQEVAALVKKYQIGVNIPAPVVRRYDLQALVRISQGDKEAPIHIVEFSDFECPYCRQAQTAFGRLQQEYGDKIRFSFKHFPLSIHRGAMYTAMAAECAHDQGKFTEFKQAIFNTAKPGKRDTILQTATQLSLDMDVFESCFNDEKHRALVEADKRDGENLGVKATPTVFVNGMKMRGARYENLKLTIDKELARIRKLSQLTKH